MMMDSDEEDDEGDIIFVEVSMSVCVRRGGRGMKGKIKRGKLRKSNRTTLLEPKVPVNRNFFFSLVVLYNLGTLFVRF